MVHRGTKITRTLPDYLRGGLEVVFVGINPGLYSASVGHYFARRGNLFWPALYESGLVPRCLRAQDDGRLLDFRMGLTDVAKRATRSASELSKDELAAGARALCGKMKQFTPRTVCFIGLTGFRAVFGKGTRPGPQQQQIGSSRIFVIPSTSRRNAHYQPGEIVQYFRQLRLWREGSAQGSRSCWPKVLPTDHANRRESLNANPTSSATRRSP